MRIVCNFTISKVAANCFFSKKVIRLSALRAGNAASTVLNSISDGRVQQEPAITDRMLGRIEHELDGFAVDGVCWKAKTLTDRGPNSQEKEFGADFLGSLTIALPDYSVCKGFLAQSKLLQTGKRLSKSELDRMKKQCEHMLGHTSCSYLFTYSSDAIRVIPAASIVASKYPVFRQLPSITVKEFFVRHFSCEVGDLRIKAANMSALESLREELNARAALRLSIESSSDKP